MSHQVIITFDMDETKIQENAEKEAGRQIAKQVIDKAFGSTLSYGRDGLMKRYVQDAVREMLESEKERIISEAIKEVVGTLGRSKAVKERLQEELGK